MQRLRTSVLRTLIPYKCKWLRSAGQESSLTTLFKLNTHASPDAAFTPWVFLSAQWECPVSTCMGHGQFYDRPGMQ